MKQTKRDATPHRDSPRYTNTCGDITRDDDIYRKGEKGKLQPRISKWGATQTFVHMYRSHAIYERSHVIYERSHVIYERSHVIYERSHATCTVPLKRERENSSATSSANARRHRLKKKTKYSKLCFHFSR
ncbi:hypothetical protein POVWA2_039090 [Plasmodium ovale wallikeri]|uniref:Uncharacterized protein n=1 Tax=Plasmodium ovale wallikeri TaxID=864142 RepID=A0A1A8Z8K6_PLAOA|nr:hypothetical protein POVWA2_039090 [Plasmodium ovale wallikeri]